MKRELAALDSPVSESMRRKTRFGNSNGDSPSLVYKRVKRPPSSILAAAVAETVVINCEQKGSELGSKVAETVESNECIVVEVSRGEGIVWGLDKKENVVGDEVKECNEVEMGMCDEGLGVENVGDVSVMEVEEKGENGEGKADENGVGEGEKVSNEVEKEKVVEETVSKTPSKKFGVESHQRRFTRSALTSDTTTKEDGKETTREDEKTGLENQVTENGNGEMKDLPVDECRRRVTRSSVVKPKEDGPDSCLTETSDSVVADKENAEAGVSDEGGENDMDKNVEDTETMSKQIATPMRLEMKMSKKIAVTRIPETVRDLLETGLLEGCPVYYDGGKGPLLHGRIRAIGICCPCNVCRGSKVIPPSLFEIHATSTYKRAVQYICLENGRSLIQILKTCKTTHLKSVQETVENAIGPLPEMEVVGCKNCQESFLTIDAECSDPVCSPCVMSNLSPVGPVYSTRKFCRSAKFGTPQGGLSCGKGKLQDFSREDQVLKTTRPGKSAKKQTETLRTPKIRSSSRAGKTSETKKSVNDSDEASPLPKTCSSPITAKPLSTKKAKKLIKKPSKPSKLTRAEKTSKLDDHVKTTKRPRKETLQPKFIKIPSVYGSSEKKMSGKITRKDIRLHKLVFEDDVLPDGTELGYYARGEKLLDGYKKGSGIFCNCCETVVSASQFESHAGCAAWRKPYCYIYTSNGVSLHELSINLIRDRTHSAKFNDDLCSICADGGDLLLCDGCPRAFHKECASLSGIPHGKWYCKYCENMFEREKFVAHNANALAAGRVSGVDPMEQITKRSIRIVKNVGSDVSSCILCRGFDFSKSGFGPRTIILCDQCEKEYHVGCLKDHDMADLTELPDGKWFCNLDCGRIDSVLQNLLIKGSEKLPESLVDVITRKNLQNVSESGADVDVSWRLLSGKIASPETRPLLSQAVAIFHESFAPIVEGVSGHDLIPAMVYGRNVGGQEYGGMYCAVLTVNSVVVSAAIFRVFGPEVAELPLVATSSGNHGKGYFQALFACIERLLNTIKVKTFVLPAAEAAKSIWVDRFGFKKMSQEQLHQLKSNFWSMVRFEGTSMLHKPVPDFTTFQTPGE